MINSDYNLNLFLKSKAIELAFMAFINLAIQLFSTKRQLLINVSHKCLSNLPSSLEVSGVPLRFQIKKADVSEIKKTAGN